MTLRRRRTSVCFTCRIRKKVSPWTQYGETICNTCLGVMFPLGGGDTAPKKDDIKGWKALQERNKQFIMSLDELSKLTEQREQKRQQKELKEWEESPWGKFAKSVDTLNLRTGDLVEYYQLNRMVTGAMYIKQTGEDPNRVFYFFAWGKVVSTGKGNETWLGKVISRAKKVQQL